MKDDSNTPNKNIHAAHRARMKQTFLKYGFDSFSDVEKVEFLLFYCIPFKDTNPLAHRLLDEFKTINGIVNAPVEALMKIDGVGEHVAIFFKVIQNTINEYYHDRLKAKHKIKGVNSAAEFCKNLFVSKQKEELVIICLDNNSYVSNYKTISKGSASEIQIEIRDITEFVINSNADRIIISHNHPTGSPKPSDDDLAFTSRVAMALMFNSIDILDHVIISPYGTFSMAKEKILEPLKKETIRLYKIPPITPKSNQNPYLLND